jgi:hypothetical protein
MIDERLRKLLDYLSDALEPARQGEIQDLYVRALNGEPVQRLPLIISHPVPADARFQPYPHHEIFEHPAKMLYNELVNAFGYGLSSRSALQDDLPGAVRANFGTVIIASLFGSHVEQVAENPPWVRRLPGQEIGLEAILDRDPCDFSQGWCPRVVESCQFYQHVLSEYPALRDLIRITLPDLQGPFDNLELIVGSDLFLDLYACPEDVQAALHAVAKAQVAFARHLQPYLSDGPEGYTHQHAVMIKGQILIRADSCILMSPQMYGEVVAPHDEYVLSEMGGGGMHTCGRADQHVEALLALPSLRCLDLGQSELNDMDSIYAAARGRGVPIVRVLASEEELVSGAVMERYPTGVTLRHEAASLAAAQRIMEQYVKSTERVRLKGTQ